MDHGVHKSCGRARIMETDILAKIRELHKESGEVNDDILTDLGRKEGPHCSFGDTIGLSGSHQ